MQFNQISFIADCIAGINASGTAVTKEMLGSGDYTVLAQKIWACALQAFNHGRAEFRHEALIFGIAFISAAPTVIAYHRQRRRKRPINAGDFDFSRRDAADLADQSRIARRAKADIMREQRRAHHIAVPVYRIGCPQYGDNRAAIGMGCA